MTFVLTVNAWSSEHQLVREDNFVSVSCQIGYDSTHDTIYSAVAQLIQFEDQVEFMFALGEMDERSGADLIVDSRVACQIIPKPCRAEVLRVFVKMAAVLIAAEQPPAFLMTTFFANLQSRQLEKYEPFVTEFRRAGYHITQYTLHDGHQQWDAQRSVE